ADHVQAPETKQPLCVRTGRTPGAANWNRLFSWIYESPAIRPKSAMKGWYEAAWGTSMGTG
ncbi:MAG: hypothetical protein ACK56I_00245, partial [bacterium]